VADINFGTTEIRGINKLVRLSNMRNEYIRNLLRMRNGHKLVHEGDENGKNKSEINKKDYLEWKINNLKI
jgi:hypothetical protein